MRKIKFIICIYLKQFSFFGINYFNLYVSITIIAITVMIIINSFQPNLKK